ncbi:MAG: NeuD/PglB/VioB family sugar acetyltransferase [Microscillaceae bacterium]|nr:NeuD/PglB/VioB family sugar acetyltransferase [Microscillaceae bacterium]
MKKLAIIGAGHLGQLIAHHTIENQELVMAGFYDDFQTKGRFVGSAKILGDISEIEKDFSEGVFDKIIIGIGYKHPELRKELYETFQDKIPFANIIHNKAIVDSSVEMGEGNVILAGSILDMHVRIENNVFINPGCVIAHDSIIASHTFLAPAVNIAGFASIGASCFLGINTTIIDHIAVCNWVRTGASSTVTKSITEKGLYVGSPAEIVLDREQE